MNFHREVYSRSSTVCYTDSWLVDLHKKRTSKKRTDVACTGKIIKNGLGVERENVLKI